MKKQITQCDSCKKDLSNLAEMKYIRLYLPLKQDREYNQDCHFCNFSCLRNWAKDQK